MIEDDLGDKGARLEVPAPLTFEEIALRTDGGVLPESLHEPDFLCAVFRLTHVRLTPSLDVDAPTKP